MFQSVWCGVVCLRNLLNLNINPNHTALGCGMEAGEMKAQMTIWSASGASWGSPKPWSVLLQFGSETSPRSSGVEGSVPKQSEVGPWGGAWIMGDDFLHEQINSMVEHGGLWEVVDIWGSGPDWRKEVTQVKPLEGARGPRPSCLPFARSLLCSCLP